MQAKGDHTPRPRWPASGTIVVVALVGRGVFVAFDARAVSAAAVGRTLGGARLSGFAREPLLPGALAPSAAGRNLGNAAEVREAMGRALQRLGHGGGRVTLVLPDGVARLALVTLAADADAREYVRFRLAGSLPWPAADGLVEVLPLGRGQVIGAAVRRATVAEYEQLASSAGLASERVHLAPLLALAGVARSREAVHVMLGDTAVSLAAVRDGAVAAFRSRRRDLAEGEATRLLEEATRTARLAGDGASAPRLVFSGSDATRLCARAGAEAAAGVAGTGEWPEAAEAAWLPGVVTA